MPLTFIETSRFSAARDAVFGGDERFRLFQASLFADPLSGTVIPGCGGIRDARWSDPKLGTGTLSALHVIYLRVPEIDAIVLFGVYDKDETTSLTPDQKRALTLAAQAAREELLSNNALGMARINR